MSKEWAGEPAARGEATPVPVPTAAVRAPEVRPLAQRPQTSGADLEAIPPESRREYFSVRLTHSGEAREFTDPREAGAAFFRADPAERPSVTHVDGNTARTMARTEIHGRNEAGEPRHVKSLPNSHAPDAAFRTGFYDAMEVSISERLSNADRGAEVSPKGTEHAVSARTTEARIDAQLKDDLETYAGARPERAAALWAEHGEGPPPGLQFQAAVNSREEGMVRADAGVPEVVPAHQRGVTLGVELRSPPDEPKRETAIYAGEDAQLILSLGRNDSQTRRLADDLVADPGFRKAVAAHVPDAEETLGRGDFIDGGSIGHLPDRVLTVTAQTREGQSATLVQFPDQSVVSRAVANHLSESPVLQAFAAEERVRTQDWRDPSASLSAWVEATDARIGKLPWDAQDDLRKEMYGIAAEAAAAFGLDREKASFDAAPRSTLYGASLHAETLTLGGEAKVLTPESRERVRETLTTEAEAIGIDPAKITRRLETGAVNARQEAGWVQSDIREVASRHRLDMGDDDDRSQAAKLVDRFYQKAADTLREAHGTEQVLDRAPDHGRVLGALAALAKVNAIQGAASFKSDDQARSFAEDLKSEFGQGVIRDLAAGRTEALAKDVPNPATRAAMAEALVSAAKEHPGIGLTPAEIEAAGQRHVPRAEALAPEGKRQPQRIHTHSTDREL
ncbi:hypothetical protein [Stagnihabitans tardus]|uniref:Large polyvalent protein-associated domain-containing protein n=1 Tax=Stagnihabitans tardus TaxID=2699202 RepID=A0AAE4YD17_9RHOB|nr:hypothetical protein [Stagnihabitans tardus]NBZ89201.1 hypothetical protein [Stagnihabitans tardus]